MKKSILYLIIMKYNNNTYHFFSILKINDKYYNLYYLYYEI